MNQSNNIPLVSVIMPSYNQGEFIEKAINSILGQTQSNWELIIVDGGSADDTLKVIKKYKKYIKHFISEPDKGQVDAIKKGFKFASGKIYCWLNSDDIFWPQTIEIVSHVLSGEKYSWVYGEGTKLAYSKKKNDFRESKMYVTKNEHRNLNMRYRLFQPAIFFTKEIYYKAGELNENLHYVLDRDLFKRMSNIQEPKYLHYKLASAHIHNAQKSSANNITKLLERGSEISHLLSSSKPSNYLSDFSYIYRIFKCTNAVPWLAGPIGFFLISPVFLFRTININRIKNYLIAYKVLK